jgi:hypothetical protein
MASNNSVFKNYNAFLRRKMIFARIMGILACGVAIASIVLMYYKLLSEWLCIIMIGYGMATAFSSNSFLQDIKIGNPWQRINMICAVFFYLVVFFLIIYGFVTGNLSTMF